MTKSKTICVISDTQAPFEDRKAYAALVRFIGEYQPDEVVHVGDLMDFPTPSQWSKGAAEEWASEQIVEEVDHAKRKLLDPLRAVYDGPVGILEGNHDERPRVYLKRYAPALAAYDWFNFENLLGFDDYGFRKLPEFYEFAPDWILTHGHRGGINLAQDAGKTALNAAVNKFHKSVIMGHTHRLGQVSKSYGFPGALKTYTGVEVGNLMDMRLAHYLKGGPANWQQGFAMVYIANQEVTVNTVPISNGQFSVEGEVYTL